MQARAGAGLGLTFNPNRNHNPNLIPYPYPNPNPNPNLNPNSNPNPNPNPNPNQVRQSKAFEEKFGQLDASYVMFGKEGTRVRIEKPAPGERSGGRSPVPAHAGGGRGAVGELASAWDAHGGPRPLDSRGSSRAPSPTSRPQSARRHVAITAPTEPDAAAEPPTPLRQPSPPPRRPPPTPRPQSANPAIGAGLRPSPPPQAVPPQGPPGSLAARKARPATADATAPHRAAPPRARAASARGGRPRAAAEERLIDAALNPRARTAASPREMGEHAESMAVSMGVSMGARPDTGISAWAVASPSASTQPSCTRTVPELHLHGR